MILVGVVWGIWEDGMRPVVCLETAMIMFAWQHPKFSPVRHV